MKNQQLSKNSAKYQALNKHLREVHFAEDGTLTDDILYVFLNDLFDQYYTFLGPDFSYRRFADDACKLVKKHREESEANVRVYLCSSDFEMHRAIFIALSKQSFTHAN